VPSGARLLYHGTSAGAAEEIRAGGLWSGYPNEPEHAVLEPTLRRARRWGEAVVRFRVPGEAARRYLAGPFEDGTYGLRLGWLPEEFMDEVILAGRGID
jgi:hypothetical protein